MLEQAYGVATILKWPYNYTINDENKPGGVTVASVMQ